MREFQSHSAGIEPQCIGYFGLLFNGYYRSAFTRQMHGVDAQTRCQVGHLFAGLYERGMEACQTVGSGLFGVYAAREVEVRVGGQSIGKLGGVLAPTFNLQYGCRSIEAANEFTAHFKPQFRGIVLRVLLYPAEKFVGKIHIEIREGVSII